MHLIAGNSELNIDCSGNYVSAGVDEETTTQAVSMTTSQETTSQSQVSALETTMNMTVGT